MKLFWGDYHKATRHLTRDQHGAYFLLIGEAWRMGGCLPNDDELLALWALCTTDEWFDMKGTILSFFTFRRGKWVHDRVRDELAKYESTSRKRKLAGKTGGSASAGKDTANPQAIAKQLPTKPEPEPERKKTPQSPPLGADLRQADIDAIWAITPSESRRRSGRKDVARTLLAAARRGKAPAQVLAGLVAYFASAEATKDGFGFVKGVHRMIENDRWEAFVEAPPDRLGEWTPDRWRAAMKLHVESGCERWGDKIGPRPGQLGCRVPPAILAEFWRDTWGPKPEEAAA